MDVGANPFWTLIPQRSIWWFRTPWRKVPREVFASPIVQLFFNSVCQRLTAVGSLTAPNTRH